MPGNFKEQQGGQCGLTRVHEGRVEEEVRELTGQQVRDLRIWTFTLSKIRNHCRILS